MAKREIIKEIKEKKERNADRYMSGLAEFYEVERLIAGGVARRTLPSIALVGVAACIEVSVRDTIKQLVDHGSPYLDRIDRYKELLKFDFDLTRAFSERQISFGEYVAHMLPISSVEQICSHVEILLSPEPGARRFSQILADLHEFSEPSDEVIFGRAEFDPRSLDANPLVVADPGQLIGEIGRLFQARHVIAHEANFESIDGPRFSIFLESARAFLAALGELVEQITNPGGSRNAMGQSIQFSIAEHNVHAEAIKLYQAMLKKLESIEDKAPAEKFKLVEVAFQEYLRLEGEFQCALYHPISGNSMRTIDAHVTGEFSRHRLQYLTEVDRDSLSIFVDGR